MVESADVKFKDPTVEEPKEMELRLVVYPDECLRDPVHGFSEEQATSELVRNTADAMKRAMYKMSGIGLAATQVGVPGAIFVLDTEYVQTEEPDKAHNPKVFLNPVMLKFDGGIIEMGGRGEGCLSTPYGYFARVPRSEKVLLEWMDLEGEMHEEWFEGIEAIAIQHEVDHLHGILFVDRLSRLKQGIFKRKARKARRQYVKGYKRALKAFKVQAKVEKRMEKAMKRKQGREDKAAFKASKKAGW